MQLFRVPINFLSCMKEVLLRATLFFFSFYLIFGNSLRLFSLSGFHGQILISEFILYFFCFFSFWEQRKWIRPLFFAFTLLIFFSLIQGMILSGFQLKATLYGLRLIFMVLSGITLGELLFKKMGSNIEKFCKFWIFNYSFCCFLGFIIFFMFPSSPSLWIFLESLGINFRGDPHEMRFISPYFDPNFFGAIAVVPFLFSWLIKRGKSSFWYRSSYLLFALSIVLTWSRSGIATFFILLIFISFSKIWNPLVLRRKGIFLFGFIALLFISVLVVSSQQLHFFVRRLIGVANDWSALCRLLSFQWGIEFFAKHPWGVGYNYLAVYLERFNQLSSVDSSLLSTLICFGAPLFLILFILYFLFCIRGYFRFQRVKKMNPMLHRCFIYFFIYLQVVVFFSSWFNNILYFQFWLIPTIAIFTYLSLCRKEILRS